MNNPFDYIPDAACDAAFSELTERLEKLKQSDRPEDKNFCRELESGKMLGILIAEDAEGVRHTLYAFSGQLGDSGFHYPGFVEPVFDYLDPNGYFKIKEAEISRQNIEIRRFEEEVLANLKSNYSCAKDKIDAEVAEFKNKCRQSKLDRDAKRESGSADKTEIASMIRQSQFEKAELHRLKKRLAVYLLPFEKDLRNAQSQLDAMKEKRRIDSESLQKWLFESIHLLNAYGKSRNLSSIFSDTPMGIPPSGAGECCAPKLLQVAYKKGLHPLKIAEYWYGRPKGGEVRIHGNHYPACRGKCLPVLSWMLQGVDVEPPIGSERTSIENLEPEIIFENRWFCVVNKPSGMLSVPGKGKAISVQQWLEKKYGSDRQVKVAHRLDQDTSGLLIATFGQNAYKMMQSLFARRKVKKTYVAELDGDYELVGIAGKGCISLPLSPDWLDRPRQRVDFAGGKEAETEYEFLDRIDGRSRIILHPLTGRTHQLRVHAASAEGLSMPIVGDRLYGKHGGSAADRLLLHSKKIEFTFPLDNQQYCFETQVPF